MSEAIIKIENVSYTYGEAKEPALRGVTLDIARGSFTAVLGHNGSGKSTLAKCFNAILIPQEGRVLVNGMDTADEERLLDIRHISAMFLMKILRIIVKFQIQKKLYGLLRKTGKHVFPLYLQHNRLNSGHADALPVRLAHSDIEFHMLNLHTFPFVVHNRIRKPVQRHGHGNRLSGRNADPGETAKPRECRRIRAVTFHIYLNNGVAVHLSPVCDFSGD